MNPIVSFLLTGLLVLFGATIASITGFGFGIAIMPFMLLLYPPKVAVPITILVAGCGGLLQWFRVRSHTDWRLVVLLSLGALVGVPLGGYALIAADATTLKGWIGLAVLTSALFSLLRREEQGLQAWRPGAPITLATGFGAGMLASSVGQPGLLAALFMARTRMDKAVIRATLVSFFVLTNAWSLTTLYFQGIFTPDLAVKGAALVPFYWLGLALGDVGFRRSTQTAHRRLSLSVLAVTSVVAVINGITALI